MSLLQNPMILLAVLGFGLMVGMPYLIDSSEFFTPLFLPFSLFLRLTIGFRGAVGGTWANEWMGE